jgi:hypothetical protein
MVRPRVWECARGSGRIGAFSESVDPPLSPYQVSVSERSRFVEQNVPSFSATIQCTPREARSGAPASFLAGSPHFHLARSGAALATLPPLEARALGDAWISGMRQRHVRNTSALAPGDVGVWKLERGASK